MAVEARHRHLFPVQISANRELMMNGVDGNVFGTPLGYGMVAPLSGTTTATEIVVPPMYSSVTTGTFTAKTAALKSDSGLTYAPAVSRKRLREVSDSLVSSFPTTVHNHGRSNHAGSFTFLGEDISFQIQQQQMEIDRFIAQQTENVRMEIEDRRKKYSRRIAAAVEENAMKKLKAKEEEIERLGKLNWALEEKVKSLCVENQIWRDLAQSNEATANTLRCNLEQALAQIHDEQQHHRRADEAELIDEAQSCCGSNCDESDRRRPPETTTDQIRDHEHSAAHNSNRICRSCEKDVSCVLLLPCRHLCLCTTCGSAIHTCPVCHIIKTASVHVNLS